MNNKIACQFLAIALLAMVFIELPAMASVRGEETKENETNIKASQISTEEIEIILGTSGSYDIGEQIYVAMAGIRSARAKYIVPTSITVELVTKQFSKEFVIGTNHGEYTEDGDWATTSGASVDRLNQNIYYSSFGAFGFDALLTLRVTMEWLAPWHQTLTATKDIEIGIGNWYNLTSQMSSSRDKIKNSVLTSVDVGVSLAVDLIENVQGVLNATEEIVSQLGELIDMAGVDPGLFNFYVMDFIGDSSHKGPLYDIARNDLYSHLADGSRDAAMDARHAAIMNSIRDATGVITAKLGDDCDPTGDGEYSYTYSFVRDLYEYDGASSPYISGAWSIDSTSKIVQSDKYGNITGGSWTAAYNGGVRNGPHDVSLEFIFEDLTGSHPRLKSPTAARFNVAVPRKSIIINTGGPYFPLLNSWYQYHELSPADDPEYTVQTLGDIATAVTSNESETRLILDDSDPMKNIRRVVMFGDNSRADLATLKLSGTDDDAFDMFSSYKYGGIQAFYDTGVPYLTAGSGLKKIGDGLKGKFAYYINMGGGKPFSKLTRDRHLGTTGKFVGDNHHEIVLEIKQDPCATSVLSGNTFTTTNFVLEVNFNRTTFQIIDIYAMITKDYGGYSIDAMPIGSTNTEYYKIETGRWVDAFFNGTDLSERDGRLASANYITAAPNTASGWYSPKAPLCGFTFEDVYVYHRIGMLYDTPVANEYTWVPFLGPNKMVPIGWMPSQDAWWSVLGTDDMKMGLEYLYGGIFMGYKETVLKLKGLAVIPAMLGAKTGIPENRLTYLFDQCNYLDDAWADVDLRRIDDIAENIIAALSDKGEGVGGNIIERPLAQASNMSLLAYSIVAKDEKQYSYIDNGLSISGSDLQLAGIGELLKDLIKTNIRPTISFLSQKVREMLKWMASVKKRVFDSALSIANNIFDAVETSISGICGMVNDTVQNIGHGLEFLGGTITNVSIEANQTITNAINDVAGWTTKQIEAVSKGAQSAVTSVVTFLNDTVLNTVKNGINFLADGIINVTNFVRDLGMSIGARVQLIGTLIGGAMIVGGTVGLFTGSVGIGAALVAGGFGVMIGGMVEGSSIMGTTMTMATTAATAVNTVRNQAITLITGAQSGAQTLINKLNGGIATIASYSAGFVGMAAGAATSVAQFATGLGMEFGDKVKSFGVGLANGTRQLLDGVTGGLDKAYEWGQRGFEALVQSNKEMIKTIITVVRSNIQNVLSLVKLAMTIIDQVSQIFENLVSKINEAFDMIGSLFTTVAGFLLDLAGTGLTLAIDFSKDVTTQLAAIENQIKSATGFYATSESLFEEIQKARVAASLIEYASQTLGTTKEIFYKWVDVIKPLSIVKGGDSSFRVFQMGNLFTDKLYFVTVYQGKLVNVDLINLKASRLPEGSESPPGGILEANIPVYSERLSNGTTITGLYYSAFTPSTTYEWYGEDKETPYVNIAPTPGRYLARVDTNLTTKVTDPHAGAKLDNFWMEETVLIAPELSVDAFPVVNVLSTYTTPITPGTQTALRLSISNEMFSKPVVSISISISTDTGFVIASRMIGNIVLPSDEEGTQIFDLAWTPVSGTPAGKYDLLVTVTEQNGDTTTKILKVEIASTGILSDILGWLVGIIGSIFGGLGFGVFIVQKRKPAMDFGSTMSIESATKTLSSTLGALRSARVDAPASCSIADMSSGSCSVNGIGLDCDPSTRKCTMKF